MRLLRGLVCRQKHVCASQCLTETIRNNVLAGATFGKGNLLARALTARESIYFNKHNDARTNTLAIQSIRNNFQNPTHSQTQNKKEMGSSAMRVGSNRTSSGRDCIPCHDGRGTFARTRAGRTDWPMHASISPMDEEQINFLLDFAHKHQSCSRLRSRGRTQNLAAVFLYEARTQSAATLMLVREIQQEVDLFFVQTISDPAYKLKRILNSIMSKMIILSNAKCVMVI